MAFCRIRFILWQSLPKFGVLTDRLKMDKSSGVQTALQSAPNILPNKSHSSRRSTATFQPISSQAFPQTLQRNSFIITPPFPVPNLGNVGGTETLPRFCRTRWCSRSRAASDPQFGIWALGFNQGSDAEVSPWELRATRAVGKCLYSRVDHWAFSTDVLEPKPAVSHSFSAANSNSVSGDWVGASLGKDFDAIVHPTQNGSKWWSHAWA